MALEISKGNEEYYTDWKGNRANPRRHGGIIAASFTCVVEILENVVFLTNATNFVTYFIATMHYEQAEAANMVTNFMGTCFLLTLFGGFVGDSFLSRCTTFIIFGLIELLGLVLLIIQALDRGLQPAANQRPSSSQAAILYAGLYAMATGVGGIKANLPAHGADQLDHGNQRLISAFFNWFFFSLCTGGLLSCTVMIYITQNLGWKVTFKISIAALCLALFIFTIGFPLYRLKPPAGSPVTRIFKVFASAWRNRKSSLARADAHGSSRNKFKFLDKAAIDFEVSEDQVVETKTFLSLLPIFGSTILMNCCLAQLQTFSVEQGIIMDRKLGSHFQIPTQALTVLPLSFMLASIPLYERFAKTYKDKLSMFEPLKRIGLGLLLASLSMALAALVESKRRHAAENAVTISVFWLAWQYLFLGVSDMFTLGGMLEFFYSKAPDSMRSMSTSLSWCSTAFGYFLSSILVNIVNSISGKYGHPWLGGHNLNHYRLDLFYTILCVLNFLNFWNYIFWAKRY